MIRASTSQSVYLGSFSLSRHTKRFLKMGLQLSCLALSTKWIAWRTSGKGCLFGSWAGHLTGRHHFYVVDRFQGQTLYPSWSFNLSNRLAEGFCTFRREKSENLRKHVRRICSYNLTMHKKVRLYLVILFSC